MQLRRKTAEPIGGQIRKILLSEVSNGTWAPGEQLPTERELSERFGVSLAPLRSALNDLTKAGVIERIQGRGTFVRDAMIPIKLGVLPSFTDSLRNLGLPFSVSVLDVGLDRPPSAVAAELCLGRGNAFRIRRLVSVRESPAACLDAWFSPAVFSGHSIRDKLEAGASAYRLARDQSGIVFDSLGGTLTVVTVDEEILSLLDLPFGSPVAKVVMTAIDKQSGMREHSTLYCDARRFSFQISVPSS